MNQGAPAAVGFATPREAAAEVLVAARTAGHGGLHAIPFNRFDPDSSTWWLSPSAENPAYRYGKILFTCKLGEPCDLFVGLYIEKGIGRSAAAPFRETARGKRHVMDETWTWNRFARALEAGDFERLAAAAEVAAGMPVTIVLDAAHVAPPAGRDDDAHSPHLPRDVVQFRFSRRELQLEAARLPAGILGAVGKPGTLSTLADGIVAVPELDWVWIDFWAGFCLAVTANRDPSRSWSAADVWQKACRPWRAWLV